MRSKKGLIIGLLLMCVGCTSREYKVTFIVDDSNYMSSIMVSSGEDIAKLETPEKDGYVFVNWQKNGLPYDVSTPIKGDITLTANFIEAPELLGEYNVVFKSDNDQASTVTVTEGKMVEKPENPVKEDYKFVGWYLDGTEYDFNNKVTRDLLLLAKYERVTLIVTYDLDGGSGIYSRTIGSGMKLPEPKTPVKFGYNFKGWMLDGKDYDFEEPVRKNLTLKAKWEKVEYVNVRFDTNGGESIPNVTLEKGSKLEVLPEATKKGYTFKYWVTREDNEKFTLDTEISSDITLLAIYEENEEIAN